MLDFSVITLHLAEFLSEMFGAVVHHYNYTVVLCRREDVESKYYADGEDAFAMKRDLSGLAEQLEREAKARKQRMASLVTAETMMKRPSLAH